MNDGSMVFLMTMVLASALVLATMRALRRRAAVPVEPEPAPRRPALYYWYRLPSGMMTWDYTSHKGTVEYGPLIAPLRAYLMFADWRWVIAEDAERGVSPSETARFFRDVMCYYPRPRPADGLQNREASDE